MSSPLRPIGTICELVRLLLKGHTPVSPIPVEADYKLDKELQQIPDIEADDKRLQHLLSMNCLMRDCALGQRLVPSCENNTEEVDCPIARKGQHLIVDYYRHSYYFNSVSRIIT